MTRVLPSVLSRFDLPEAELHAAKLDGELFAIDECFGPVDIVELSHHRGQSLSRVLPPRLIAELRTAAWVLGALGYPPYVRQVCADSAARYRCIGVPRLSVREVVLHEDDTVYRGGLRVTTPLRTTLDLARFNAEFDGSDALLVGRLAEIGSFGLAEVLEDLDGRRHLPGKSRAANR